MNTKDDVNNRFKKASKFFYDTESDDELSEVDPVENQIDSYMMAVQLYDKINQCENITIFDNLQNYKVSNFTPSEGSNCTMIFSFDVKGDKKVNRWNDLIFKNQDIPIFKIKNVIEKDKRKKKYIKECSLVTCCFDTNLSFYMNEAITINDCRVEFKFNYFDYDII